MTSVKSWLTLKHPLLRLSPYLAGKSANFRLHARLLCSNQKDFTTTAISSKTVGYLRQYWVNEFEKAQILEPKLSVDYLLYHSLGINGKNPSLSSLRDAELKDDQLEKFNRAVQCRLARMPTQYIVGDWDFLDINLKLVPPVFIPRPETEQLVLLALDHLSNQEREKPSQSRECLELCTGSGAISLAILHRNPTVRVTAVERSQLAFNLAKENAQRLKLEPRFDLIHASLEEEGLRGAGGVVNFEQRFDLIVSNPPYVPNADLRTLAPEILLYEDLRALDGGRDGLRLVNVIIHFAPLWLKPGGILLLELDPRHPAALLPLVNLSRAWANAQVHQDFSGKNRFLELVTSSS